MQENESDDEDEEFVKEGMSWRDLLAVLGEPAGRNQVLKSIWIDSSGCSAESLQTIDRLIQFGFICPDGKFSLHTSFLNDEYAHFVGGMMEKAFQGLFNADDRGRSAHSQRQLGKHRDWLLQKLASSMDQQPGRGMHREGPAAGMEHPVPMGNGRGHGSSGCHRWDLAVQSPPQPLCRRGTTATVTADSASTVYADPTPQATFLCCVARLHGIREVL